MAAAIREATGFEAELIPGAGGIFDVAVDGEVIYSRHATGLFPKPEQIVAMLSERLSR